MIGYYVHHHGLGHLARATGICTELAASGHRVVGFSSLPRPEGWPGEWVELPADTTDHPDDETAGGVLHWAPLRHEGHRRRLHLVTDRLTDVDVMVVDVSAEVALLARLFGVPTVVVAMRGDRSDRAHLTAYDAATALVATWHEEFAEPWWPSHWVAKTHFVGAASRFDDLTPPPLPSGSPSRVLGIWGGGGSDATAADVESARAATPGWTWTWRSPASPSPDLWDDLRQADVVVCHGGNNTVAEVAAARRPAVVVAQSRPFDEQHHTVRVLGDAGLAVALEQWPAPERWPALLDDAVALGGHGWARWNRHDGLRRAATAIAAVRRGVA